MARYPASMSLHMSRIGLIVITIGAALPALADTQFRIRAMTRNDVPPGKGQCDIRLQVDNEAEVSVRGDSVFIHTIAGRDPRDDGSECNMPLPDREIQGFNYEVKDSRGEIRLVAPPSERNRNTAVVYIRDPASGEGRYHFRLSWVIGGGGGGRDERRDDRGPGAFRWDDEIMFRGEGRGSMFFGGGGEQRLSDANVSIDRRGSINVTFRAEGGRTVTFAGNITGRDGGRIRADVEGMRTRGQMFLSVDDRRNINSITMEAGDGRDRMRLNWDRR